MAENELKTARSNNLIDSLYYGTAEKTAAESPRHSDSQEAPYNRDALWKKTGDYSIYDEMIADDQVSVTLQIKKDLVLGSGFDIVCDGDDQEEIKEDIEKALVDDCQPGFSEMLEEILSAYEYGFSLTEKIFKRRDDGSLTLNTMKSRHPDTWTIHTDKKGNVINYEQHQMGGDVKVNPKSLIHYINKRKFQNPYGTSDLRTAYEAWFTKRQVIRYFGIYLEKNAAPIPVAKYKAGIPSQVVDDIHDIIKKFQASTAITIPDSISVDFLQAKTVGDIYISAINLFNMFIGRAMLIPDLMGFAGSETDGGSFSLGEHQINVFFKHIARRRQTLERVVNKEIIWPLVVYNHGFVDKYPRFRLKPIKDEDAFKMAELWVKAIQGNTHKATLEEINHFRKSVKFPESEEGEIEAPALPENPEEPGQKLPKEVPDDMPEPPTSEEVKQFKKEMASKNIDYKAIEKSLDERLAMIIEESNPVVKKIFVDLKDQIQKKKILEKQDMSIMDNVKVKYLKELKQVIKSNLFENFKEAKKTAMREIIRHDFAEPLPSDEFLAFLDRETFDYIGDWEYELSKNLKVELRNAIANGHPISSVFEEMDNIDKQMRVSIERYARTKTTETMNKGRKEFFDQTDIVNGYQYSAIIDGRTTDICQGLHEKFFKKGSEPTPPLHFNCRSVLVPMTIYEQYDPTKKINGKSVNSFIKSTQHKGFEVL